MRLDYDTTDYAVVTEDLEEGDLVVVDTSVELEEGTPAEILEVQESIL